MVQYGCPMLRSQSVLVRKRLAILIVLWILYLGTPSQAAETSILCGCRWCWTDCIEFQPLRHLATPEQRIYLTRVHEVE